MKIKQILFVSALTFFVALAEGAKGQAIAKNTRQTHLETRETVNANKANRIAERNPNGVGRHDNRVARRGHRIDRKKQRTDWRVKRRRGKN